MDLLTWYLAQLDEDEAVARACFSRLQKERGRWYEHFNGGMQVRDDAGNLVVAHSWPNEIAHIVRHDPAHVLADIAAKRAIVRDFIELRDDPTRLTDAAAHMCYHVMLRVVVKLTRAYADRSGYDPAWASS